MPDSPRPESRPTGSGNRSIGLRSAYATRRSLAVWYLRRGVIPAFRGLLRSPLYRNAAIPLVIGTGVKVLGGKHISFGRGVVIGDHCWFSCVSRDGVHIAENVTIREYGWIQCSSSLSRPLGVGITIGPGTYLGPRCYLGASGAIHIGSACDIGGSLTVLAENHTIPEDRSSIRDHGTTARGVTIGDHCWIGNNVTILDGVTVGDGAVIGAGAVVSRDLPPFSVAHGVPARVSRIREERPSSCEPSEPLPSPTPSTTPWAH